MKRMKDELAKCENGLTSGIISRMPTEGRLSRALNGLKVDAEGELTKDRRSFSMPVICNTFAHILCLNPLEKILTVSGMNVSSTWLFSSPSIALCTICRRVLVLAVSRSR